MLLASVADIREGLGFDDMTDITAAIEQALHAAEPHLAAQIGTPSFGEVDAVDTFYVHEPGLLRGTHVETQFRLTYGFLQASGFAGVHDTTYLFAAPTTLDDLAVKLEKGLVADYVTNFSRTYVRFSYNAGFPADGSNAESYDLDEVPGWLQEAAKLQALIMLETHPSLDEARIQQDTKALQAQLGAILAQHRRYAPLALLPL
jgi:hypothetical protein